MGLANYKEYVVRSTISGYSDPSFVNLQVLGSGFEVISVGRRKLVRSVPTELNRDHNGILGLAQVCATNIVTFSPSTSLQLY